ncbi:MAG: hypothetical protein ACO1NS_02085 [Daejeonella sp.]
MTEVIVVESDTFQKMQSMFSVAMEAVKQLSSENFILKNRYLSAEEVGQLTGYHTKTIKIRKDEIGYITQGKDLKFKLDDVNTWMMRYYIKPHQAS